MDSDSDASEEIAPLPEPARRSAAASSAADVEDEEDVELPPEKERERTLSPPPSGWTWQPKVLMADGAMAADRALARVFSGVAAPLDGGPSGPCFTLDRGDLVYWRAPDSLDELCTKLATCTPGSIAFDLERLTVASATRPRPDGVGGGKVAVIILATMVPLDLDWLPEGETPHWRGLAVHVIQLSTWAMMPLSLHSMLASTQLVGHNAKGDATHLRKDYNLTLKEPLCTMALAKKLLGPRQSWNPNSQWGLNLLTMHLLGKGLSKDVTLSDWEATPLTDEQLSYAGLDALATLLDYQTLTLIEEHGANPLGPLKWLVPKDDGSNSRHTLKHLIGYPVTVLELGDDDDDDDGDGASSLGLSIDEGRSFGLLLQRGSRVLQAKLGEQAAVGNLSYASYVEGNDLTCLLSAYNEGDDEDDGEPHWPASSVKWAAQDRFRPDIIIKDQEEGGQPLEEEDESVPSSNDPSITRGICSVHAASWLHKSGGGKGYFKTHETKNKEKQADVEKKMKADIMRVKNQPVAKLEKEVLKLMFKKWRREYKEKDVAKQFPASWVKDKTFLCRTSLNPMGGIPNDNNGLEGTNGTQKEDENFERYGMTQFIPRFAGNIQSKELGWLQHQSCEDLHMAGCMTKLGKSNSKVNVWDQLSFTAAREMFLTFKLEQHGPFGCMIHRTDLNGLKVIDIPSRRILTLLLGNKYHVADDPKALNLALCHTGNCRGGSRCSEGCEDSWHCIYEKLINSSTLPTLSQGSFTFDLYMDYATAFHTLTPILDVVFVERLIDRLRNSDMQLDLSLIQSGGADSELDIERMKKWGFCSCNCRIYLHYLWCVHVCTDGLVKKLILKFPKAYSVKRLGVDMDGRACKALRGGALGYQ